MKTYDVGTQMKRLTEALHMSTHNKCFCWEIRKKYQNISVKTKASDLELWFDLDNSIEGWSEPSLLTSKDIFSKCMIQITCVMKDGILQTVEARINLPI